MVSSVYWEWEFLLTTIKLGVKLAFIYDGIRIFRFLITHKNIVVSLEDLFFWIYAAGILFKLQLEQSNGVLRGFSILGILSGMFLYNRLIGERLVGLAEKGIGFTKRQLTESVKMLKIKLCKHCNVFENSRSKHGREKNPGKKKEAEQSCNAVSNDGSSGNDGGSCRK